MNLIENQSITVKRLSYFILIAILIFFLFHFREVAFFTKYLLNNDIAYSFMYGNKISLPKSFWSTWLPFPLLGGSHQTTLLLENILLFLFGVKFMMSWGFLLPIVFLFFVAFFCFRKLSFHPIASLLGAFFTAFNPVFLTYLRVGHLGKLYLIFMVFIAFYFLNKLIYAKKVNIVEFLLLAFFIAFCFLGVGAIQTALYFSFWWPLYFFYFMVDSLKDYTKKRILNKVFKKTIFFSLATLLAIFLASPMLLEQFKGATSDETKIVNSTVLSAAEQKQKLAETWNWATQWSNHPLEITELFIPGIWGFLSNDPNYPYWGKVGQTSNWIKHKQGFRNFSLVAHYLGILIFIFAFYSLIFVKNRAKWFWFIMAIFNLLLSFGRYFPLYFLFFKLPYMDTMRNPNKFYLVFYFAMTMLSIYGLNHFIKMIFSAKSFSQLPTEINQRTKKFFNGFNAFILFVIFGLLISSFIFKDSLKDFLKSYNYSSRDQRVILDNIVLFLIKGLVFYLLALVPFYLIFYYDKSKEIFKSLTRFSQQKTAVVIVLYLLVFGFVDIFLVNKIYLTLQDMPKEFPPADPLAEFLEDKKEQGEPYRLKFIGNGYYHQYFLYNQINSRNLSVFDPLALRMGYPAGILLLLQNASPILAYNSLAINYFLTIKPLLPQKSIAFEKQVNFNNGEKAYLYKNSNATPLVYFTTNTVLKNNTTDIGDFWRQTNFSLTSTSMVHERKYQLSNTSNFQGNIKILTWENDQVEFEISNNEVATLVLANQYHPNWYLKIGEQTIKPFKINHFFNGYKIPATKLEKATLFFSNKSQRKNFYFALCFYLGLISLLVVYIFNKNKNFPGQPLETTKEIK